nr:MAG TPA: replisome organizer [Caudoviricetes sp.]
MMSKSIIETDKFMDMPMSAQCLYFHLLLRADDDGFIVSPKRTMRSIGCTDDDMKILIAKSYVLAFESGVIVVKHWRIHNYVKRDRYKQSSIPESKLIMLDENREYQYLEPKRNQSGTSLEPKRSKEEREGHPEYHEEYDKINTSDGAEPNWNQNGTKMEPKWFHRLDKIRLDKIRGEEIRKDKKEKQSVSLKTIIEEFAGKNSMLFEAVKDWIEMRKTIKAPLTARAASMSFKRLCELSHGNESMMIEILNQSTLNCWKGLFPLKTPSGLQNQKSKIQKTAEMFERMNVENGTDKNSEGAIPADWDI